MIADSNTVRRLDAFGIQVDLAAVDRRRRQTPGLEEPGMPQPFVQAMIVIVLVSCHKHSAPRIHERASYEIAIIAPCTLRNFLNVCGAIPSRWMPRVC